MQRGIDSFFKRVTPANLKAVEQESPVRAKRKARVIISSDEDEVCQNTQVDSQQKKKTRSDKTSPSAESSKSVAKKHTTSPNASSSTLPKREIKKVDPASVFDGEILRIEAKKPPKPKEAETVELEDNDIDQSLLEVDLDKTISANTQNKQKEKERKLDESLKNGTADLSPPTKVKTPTKIESVSAKKHKLSEVWKNQTKEDDNMPDEKKPKKENTSRAKKEHSEDLETSVLSDEERHERKRASAMLYQKYKNRQSVINAGCKEVPKGKANCLAGLTFLVSGVLESLERDETASIIKEYGGKMMTVVGKRLNYLIVGEEAGPKKLVQAQHFNIPIISEDEFFDLIRTKSGQPTKGDANADETKIKPSTSPKVKTEKIHKETAVKKEKVSPKKKTSPKNEAVNESKNITATTIKSEKVSPPLLSKAFAAATIQKPQTEIDGEQLAWVDKYKPTCVKDIIGQQGAASNVVKLTNWLSKWYINHDGKKKLQKPNPWAKNDDGSYFKAALLSGPPGIGKTTTATLVCKELGFDTVEFNASDTRSKRLLKEEVSELLSNKSLHGYFCGDGQAVTKKHVLIMDEVDGMAGNQDRGGIQELIGLIKDTSVPIICMCNDRNHQKMRSLVNYCYDLRFNKPRLEQIKGRILSICFKEQMKIDTAKVEEIITATNNDIRQSINYIALLSADKDLQLKSNGSENVARKDLKIGPWEVVRKVFSAEEHKHMSIHDKSDLFFHDYSLAPLFVQQNYLQVTPNGPKSEVLQKVALTADALSLGDLVDKRIRSNSAWVLLPTMAMFSSVMPGDFMAGHFTGQINFPAWLGKNSRATKRCRLAQEIHDHTRLRTSGSRLSVRLEYAPHLLANIVRPLVQKGMEGIEESLAVIKEYRLLREDLDALIELTSWPGKKSAMDQVDGRVKATLTRAYNKEVMAYSYSGAAGVKKKKAESVDIEGELLGGEEGEGEVMPPVVSSDEEKEDDNLENDGLIKTKKRGTTKATTSKAAATSKAATTSKASTAKKTSAATNKTKSGTKSKK